MKKEEIAFRARKKYLEEYEIFDGENFVTFNVLDCSTERNTVTIAVTKQGKISVVEFDLFEDEYEDLYFEYAPELTHIDLDYFYKPIAGLDYDENYYTRRLAYAK